MAVDPNNQLHGFVGKPKSSSKQKISRPEKIRNRREYPFVQ